MLVNYMQKQNEILELLRYFKALELFYNFTFFSQSPQRLPLANIWSPDQIFGHNW
jgi:hypothetical protein